MIGKNLFSGKVGVTQGPILRRLLFLICLLEFLTQLHFMELLYYLNITRLILSEAHMDPR